MDNSQMLKGVLEGCVLSIIVKRETYGYEILTKLEEAGFQNIGEGTLYPVLTRLEKKGYILCRKEKSPFGPIRKYYSASDDGIRHFKLFKESYYEITDKAMNILGNEEK